MVIGLDLVFDSCIDDQTAPHIQANGNDDLNRTLSTIIRLRNRKGFTHDHPICTFILSISNSQNQWYEQKWNDKIVMTFMRISYSEKRSYVMSNTNTSIDACKISPTMAVVANENSEQSWFALIVLNDFFDVIPFHYFTSQWICSKTGGCRFKSLFQLILNRIIENSSLDGKMILFSSTNHKSSSCLAKWSKSHNS